MFLAEIKNDVTKFAEVICKVLEVDVLIVDSNLKTISNTYRYPDKPIPIRRTSIISQVISSGKTITIDDKSSYNTCKECQDFEECDMRGFICVPIFYKEMVVGAIALILPQSKINEVFSNIGNSIEFLERMSDLLASKIQNKDDYNNLNLIKCEREVIMDSIDYAMVSMDEIGYITYYNKRFNHYFGGKNDYLGKFILDILPHKYVTDFLSNYTEFYDRLMYFEKDDNPFYGFLSCMNINIDGSRGGMLFVFKSFADVNSEVIEIGYNNRKITFKSIENALIPMNIIDEAKSLAITSKTVLIRGESGLQKELIAKAIHAFSDREDHCFTLVNCSGSYQELLEESLFGNEYSDQLVGVPGKLQLSHKGTIFFNRIENMPIYLQERLAEILKTKTIRQGGLRENKVDLRMIFSTSTDLSKLVREGSFNDDLYYRISQNAINIPPLREDKELLRKLLLNRAKFYCEKYNKSNLVFDDQAIEVMLNYDWPRNRVELEKVMDSIVSWCVGKVKVKDLEKLNLFDIQKGKVAPFREIERESISSLIKTSKNKDEVANMLGISRATLYRKIKKYNL